MNTPCNLKHQAVWLQKTKQNKAKKINKKKQEQETLCRAWVGKKKKKGKKKQKQKKTSVVWNLFHILTYVTFLFIYKSANRSRSDLLNISHGAWDSNSRIQSSKIYVLDLGAISPATQ